MGQKLGAKTWGRRLAHERPIQIDRALGNCSRRHKRARATGPHFSDLATCPDAMGEGGSGGERGELSVEACAEPSWPRSRPGCRAARDSLRTPGASTAPPDDSFMQDRMPLRGRDPGAEVGERVAVREQSSSSWWPCVPTRPGDAPSRAATARAAAAGAVQPATHQPR